MICINMKLPSLNTYIDRCKYNKNVGNSLKQNVQSDIAKFLTDMPVYTKPIFIHFLWVEKKKVKGRKRDLDNICSAKKYILDAMVKLKKIKDDGRKFVVGFSDLFIDDEIGETRVYLKIDEISEKSYKDKLYANFFEEIHQFKLMP